MKTIFRALALAIFMTAFSAATVTPTYAQDGLEENIALYKKYTDNYAGTTAQKKIAIEAGKQYIEKYGTNADYAAQVDYLKKDVPRLESLVATVEAAANRNAAITRFDTSVSGKNWDETYTSGKAILAQTPDLLDVILVLGSIGYDESLKTPANTKYNADTINYAKSAIQKLEAGKTSQNYGAYQYTYSGVKEFPNGKENALGWMNYNIGYLMYFNQNQKKEAIPYLYKAAKSNSAVKNFPVIYQTIGESYFDEAKRLDQESRDKIKAANNTETDESKVAYALAKGYADRAIDAYARAYKIASANPAAKKEYKDGLYSVMQNLYKFRYDGKIEGIDAYVAGVMSRP
ncbi:MAG: hypothetical protein M3525_16855, partial [Acidobacteriota bacterium]|nr:hypothetical protein [Acidobacteriota bacterium]